MLKLHRKKPVSSWVSSTVLSRVLFLVENLLSGLFVLSYSVPLYNPFLQGPSLLSFTFSGVRLHKDHTRFLLHPILLTSSYSFLLSPSSDPVLDCSRVYRTENPIPFLKSKMVVYLFFSISVYLLC